MSYCATNLNLCITQNTSFTRQIVITGQDGLQYNLSGYSGYAPIFANWGLTDFLGHFNISVNSTGVITLSLENTGSAALPSIEAIYLLNLYNSSGNTESYLKGYLDIYPGI